MACAEEVPAEIRGEDDAGAGGNGGAGADAGAGGKSGWYKVDDAGAGGDGGLVPMEEVPMEVPMEAVDGEGGFQFQQVAVPFDEEPEFISIGTEHAFAHGKAYHYKSAMSAAAVR